VTQGVVVGALAMHDEHELFSSGAGHSVESASKQQAAAFFRLPIVICIA
jgi:hypothetical protein